MIALVDGLKKANMVAALAYLCGYPDPLVLTREAHRVFAMLCDEGVK